MIFYFSGTGNSLYVAKRLNEAIGGEIRSIPECIYRRKTSYQMKPGERLGFVFPTHVWGTPWLVDDFIESLDIQPAPGYGSRESRLKGIYTFAVITYGSSIGDAADTFEATLAGKGMKADLICSVKMPDSYVIGADVPALDKAAKILADAEDRIDGICMEVIGRRSVTSVHKGRFSLFLSRTHGIYKHYGRKTDDFFADDSCDSCGLCEDLCESNIIELDPDGKPRWTLSQCSYCLACINRCPQHAIQFGQHTAKRGRYFNPNLQP